MKILSLSILLLIVVNCSNDSVGVNENKSDNYIGLFLEIEGGSRYSSSVSTCNDQQPAWWIAVESFSATNYLRLSRDSVYFYCHNFFKDSIAEFSVDRAQLKNFQIAPLFDGYYFRCTDTLCDGDWILGMEGPLSIADSAQIKQLIKTRVRL